MSLECGECEQDLRIGHAMDCSRRKTTQNPAQDVSDARCSFLAGYVCAAMAHAHSSFTSDQILRLANKEADKRQWGEAARELQQAQPTWTKEMLADVDLRADGLYHRINCGLQQAQVLDDAYMELDEDGNPRYRLKPVQQAQVVGGKIANGHHCGLPERLCNHPSHTTPQSSAPVVGDVTPHDRGRRMYEDHVSSHPTIHSNRFPAWHELTNAQRQGFMNEASESALTGRSE